MPATTPVAAVLAVKRRKPVLPCTNCKRDRNHERLLYKELCHTCYAYQRTTGKVRPVDENGNLVRPEKICSNCEIPVKRLFHGRCSICCDYWKRTGKEHPIAIPYKRYSPCQNCGNDREAYLRKGRCSMCGKYWRKHGTERPPEGVFQRRIQIGVQCRNCGCPHQRYLTKGRCHPCYKRFHKTKTERRTDILRACCAREVTL